MSKHAVLCDTCAREIDEVDDLYVVSHWGVSVRAYCRLCYANKEKTYWHHPRTGSIPINSRPVSVSLIAGGFLAVLSVFFSSNWTAPIVLWFGLLWMGALRLIAFLRYERPLQLREG